MTPRPMSFESTPTRRARAVNYGDKTTLAGSEEKTLAWISVEESQAFTVYATARVEAPPAVPLARIQPLVTIEWGHGGASVVGEYPVVRRLRVPLAASMIQLSGRLVDLATGKAPPATVTCDLVAVIAPGVDGQTQRNTRWIVQAGASALVAAGPQNVLTIEGHNATDDTRWLMLFDATELPADGTRPVMATPAPRSPGAFRIGRADARSVLAGAFWAASTDPLALKHDTGARLHVETELLL